MNYVRCLARGVRTCTMASRHDRMTERRRMTMAAAQAASEPGLTCTTDNSSLPPPTAAIRCLHLQWYRLLIARIRLLHCLHLPRVSPSVTCAHTPAKLPPCYPLMPEALPPCNPRMPATLYSPVTLLPFNAYGTCYPIMHTEIFAEGLLRACAPSLEAVRCSPLA